LLVVLLDVWKISQDLFSNNSISDLKKGLLPMHNTLYIKFYHFRKFAYIDKEGRKRTLFYNNALDVLIISLCIFTLRAPFCLKNLINKNNFLSNFCCENYLEWKKMVLLRKWIRTPIYLIQSLTLYRRLKCCLRDVTM
jgi:hypothetical protein